MKPSPFTYHRAHSADEAIELLGELGDEAKLLAGGQSLVPMMNFRLARPSALVDIGGIADWQYLRRDGDALRIGALTRHRAVENAMPAPVHGYGVLPRAARWIGHFPIRTRGTFGGSVAHADPTAEWCVLSLLLDADIALQGPAGTRTVPAASWFTGFMSTACGADEMVTEVTFPRPRGHAALTEYARRHGDFGIVVAAVAFDVAGGVCTDVAIALGGVAGTPVRLPDVERAVTGQPPTAETWRAAAAAAAAAVDPPGDVHGSTGYRKQLVDTLLQRAFAEAAGDAAGARRGTAEPDGEEPAA
jgi:carbon-monoxide dehydrogenase medium subunit